MFESTSDEVSSSVRLSDRLQLTVHFLRILSNSVQQKRTLGGSQLTYG